MDPRDRSTQVFMARYLNQFQQELRDSGCSDVRGLSSPSLTNDISPIFGRSRWAKGHSQHTREIWAYLTPALQLASLWISESCMLPWFMHLTCGDLVNDRSTRKHYIEPSEFSRSSQAKVRTLETMNVLGSMLTFMFTPREHFDGSNYGLTRSHLKFCPFLHVFRDGDLPHIPDRFRGPRNRHGLPLIQMSPDFQDFFLDDFQTASPSQRYRMSFLFAATITHEYTHALGFFLGLNKRNGDEPHWCKYDLKHEQSELGYSWETMVLGRIINPMFGRMHDCRALISFQSSQYNHPSERERALMEVLGREARGSEWTRVPNPDGQTTWNIPPSMRGTGWFSSRRSREAQGSVATIHALPTQWLASWFSESDWDKRRMEWREHRDWSPPSLGPTFTLLHEVNPEGQCCLRIPTNSRIEADPYRNTVRTQAHDMHLYDDEDHRGRRSSSSGRHGGRRSSSGHRPSSSRHGGRRSSFAESAFATARPPSRHGRRDRSSSRHGGGHSSSRNGGRRSSFAESAFATARPPSRHGSRDRSSSRHRGRRSSSRRPSMFGGGSSFFDGDPFFDDDDDDGFGDFIGDFGRMGFGR